MGSKVIWLQCCSNRNINNIFSLLPYSYSEILYCLLLQVFAGAFFFIWIIQNSCCMWWYVVHNYLSQKCIAPSVWNQHVHGIARSHGAEKNFLPYLNHTDLYWRMNCATTGFFLLQAQSAQVIGAKKEFLQYLDHARYEMFYDRLFICGRGYYRIQMTAWNTSQKCLLILQLTLFWLQGEAPIRYSFPLRFDRRRQTSESQSSIVQQCRPLFNPPRP